jgi:hypothetical protein
MKYIQLAEGAADIPIEKIAQRCAPILRGQITSVVVAIAAEWQLQIGPMLKLLNVQIRGGRESNSGKSTGEVNRLPCFVDFWMAHRAK